MPAVITIALVTQIAVTMAVSFAVSYVVSNFITPKNGGGDKPKDPGVRIQVPPDTTTTVPVVYGSAYLGGKFVDGQLVPNGFVMYYVMAISCVSESGQFTFDTTKMYYGDRLMTFDGTDTSKVIGLTDGAGNYDTKISGNLYISLYVSDKDGNITNINNDYPWNVMGPGSELAPDQRWPTTGRRMNGLAFAIVRLVYNRDAGTTQLQPITFHCNQDLFGAGTCTPGAAWYDYMTNPVYGAGVDESFVDEVSAQALDVYSNEYITFTDYNGNPQTQHRYRINGVINASDNVLKNVDQILTCCDSWMQYNATSGKWAVVVNKAESPSYSFDDSNIIESITVGSIDITQMVNQIEGKFPDATNRDQYNYVNLSVPSGLLLPNEPVNKLSINYDLVNNSVQALYLANRVLEQSREDLLVTIDTTYDGIQVEAGEVVSLTNAAYGWDNKLFRVMQVKESVMDNCLTAQLQLIEYNSAVYDNFDINQYTPAPNSGLISSQYFSTLTAPKIADQQPSAAVPSFSVDCLMPATGRVTNVTLYYTTVSSPSSTDWTLLSVQNAPNSTPFVNGTTLKFTHISLPTNAYYFAFTVGNNVGQSNLSPVSSVYNWLPTPTTTAVAGTFVASFSPPVLQIPYDGSANFTGIVAALYGTTSGGSVDFVASQTDSDSAFLPNTWRIGGSSTSGYADIVKTNITIGSPTDGGSYALFPQPTAMSGNPATIDVPVRYKDSGGAVSQGATASLQYSYNIKGDTGNAGNKYSTAYLYQWGPTTPLDPNGTSTYTWLTGENSSYTGTNGWEVTIPANPGTPLFKLYSASKGINASSTDVSTAVDWSTGFSVQAVGANGAAGLQSANPTVYQWAVTIPSAPSGTSAYTWATNTFTPIPSGWSDNPGTSPSPGYTLWGATVALSDSSTVTTSTINWSVSSITARGYAGQAGSSARICYASTSATSLSATPTTYTTSGSSSYPPTNTWGGSETWVATPPSITAGQSVWQSDGIYSPVTGNTVWNVPYLSNLKVGSLSAISANLGTINAGSITGVTITGGTIRTAESGQRITMTAADNYIKVYNSAGTVIGEIGGSAGVMYANTTGGSYTLAPTMSAYGDTPGGNYPSSDVPVLYSSNAHGDGIQGISQYNGVGLFGVALRTGGTNHGLRAVNKALSGPTTISTSGLVGTSIAYDFYADGSGTNYGPFTGAHDVLVPINQDIPVGYIVNDVQCLVKKNISNTVFEVTMSSATNQVPIGVMVANNGLLANMTPAAFIEYTDYSEETPGIVMYPEYDECKNDYNYCAANAVGEGQVYVCGEAGNIAAGDLIVTSSTPGVGMKQSDDIVRNITVAKAREAITFTDTTTPVLVACIYLCG